MKVYRLVQTSAVQPDAALRAALANYRNPVAAEVIEFEIQFAVKESRELGFCPRVLC